jgi:hypothetical protein
MKHAAVLVVTLPMFGKRYISWQHLGFTPCASHNASTALEGAARFCSLCVHCSKKQQGLIFVLAHLLHSDTLLDAG